MFSLLPENPGARVQSSRVWLRAEGCAHTPGPKLLRGSPETPSTPALPGPSSVLPADLEGSPSCYNPGRLPVAHPEGQTAWSPALRQAPPGLASVPASSFLPSLGLGALVTGLPRCSRLRLLHVSSPLPTAALRGDSQLRAPGSHSAAHFSATPQRSYDLLLPLSPLHGAVASPTRLGNPTSVLLFCSFLYFRCRAILT